jgi:hypothetical protein
VVKIPHRIILIASISPVALEIQLCRQRVVCA